jgi:hypothetical protein
MNVSESEDFKRVVEENEELKGKIETVSIERYELIQLKEEISRLKQIEEDRNKMLGEFGSFLDSNHRPKSGFYYDLEGAEVKATRQISLIDEQRGDHDKFKEHVEKLNKDPEYRRRFKAMLEGTQQEDLAKSEAEALRKLKGSV